MEGTIGGSIATEEEIWSASTNWDVAEGSAIRDPISFETSADDDAASPTSRRSLVLLRPLYDESVPCEVTVYFKEKHELHQIYVRSTARVYEIYCTLNQLNNSKEYLSTVRCGVATEVMPSSFIEEAVPEGHNGFETVNMQGSIPRSDSSGNEDEWIEVQVSNTASQNYKLNMPSRYADVFYEATAQISDASPCLSITLRFLSLQTRTRVQIDEIYIYADPVDSLIPDEPAGREETFGGNSLLAMFVPTLMQLSRSGKSDVQTKFYSDPSGISKSYSTSGSASAQKECTLAQEAHLRMKEQNLPFQQKKVEVKPLHSTTDQNVTDHGAAPSTAYQSIEMLHSKPEIVRLESCHIVSDQECYSTIGNHTLKPAKGTKCYSENLVSTSSLSGPAHISECNHEDGSQSNGGIEKKLDELVSRIGRIEVLFSRFEESLVNPMNSIDSRLQLLEQQFNAFAVGHQFCGKGSSSKISAPEFSFDNTDSATNEKYNTSCEVKEDIGFIIPPLPAKDVSYETNPKTPDVSEKYEDNVKINSSSTSESDDSSKAPDVPETGENNVKINNASASDLDESTKRKNHSSIDHALASALAAFMTSKPIEDAKDQNDPFDAKERDMSSYDRTIPKETDDIKNSKLETELEPDTAIEGSMHSALTDSDTPESDHENAKLNISGEFANSTAFDDSSDDELDLSFPPSKTHSGLKILAPEFPSDDDDSVDSDGSDPTYKGHHENEEFMPYDSMLISAFTALDPPLEFRTSSSITTSTVAGEDANHHDNDEMNNEIDCDYILHSLVQEMAQPLGIKSDSSSIMNSHDEGILCDTRHHGNTANSHKSFSHSSVLKSHKDHVDLADYSERTFLAGSSGLEGRVVNENTCSQASDGASPDGVQKHFFSYMPFYDDSLVNVKFDSDRSLQSDLPLDILLGETYISAAHGSDSKDLNFGESYSTFGILLDKLLGETDVPEGQNTDADHADDDTGELHLLKSQWKDPSSSIMSQLVRDVDRLSLGDEVSGLYSDVAEHNSQSREVPFSSLI